MAGHGEKDRNGQGGLEDLGESYPDVFTDTPEQKDDDGGHSQPLNPGETEEV